MKILKILGCIILILLGVTMIFTGTIMCDLKTPYTVTAIMLIILGIVIGGAGFICLVPVCMESN